MASKGSRNLVLGSPCTNVHSKTGPSPGFFNWGGESQGGPRFKIKIVDVF